MRRPKRSENLALGVFFLENVASMGWSKGSAEKSQISQFVGKQALGRTANGGACPETPDRGKVGPKKQKWRLRCSASSHRTFQRLQGICVSGKAIAAGEITSPPPYLCPCLPVCSVRLY